MDLAGAPTALTPMLRRTKGAALAGAFLVLLASGRRISASDPHASNLTKRRPGMVLLAGGSFAMGSEDGDPDEHPVRHVTLAGFWIDKTEVTVGDFERFMSSTAYRTEAEGYGWSGVFLVSTKSWETLDGATWKHPDGPASAASSREPVSQVS